MEVDTAVLIDYAHGLLNPDIIKLVREQLEKDEFLRLEYSGIVKLMKAYPDRDIYEVIREFASEKTSVPDLKAKQFDKESFFELINDIVKELIPTERLAFRASGAILIDDLFAGQEIGEENAAGILNFKESPSKVIVYVHVINATYHYLFRTPTKSEKSKNETGQMRWERLLKEYGIADSLAKQIAELYIDRTTGRV